MAKLHYKDSPSDKERKAFAQFLAEDEELILVTGLGKAFIRSKFIVIWSILCLILALLGLGLAYFFKYDLLLGMGIGVLLACLFAFLRTSHLYHANRYLLTTRRVIIKRGIFAVQLTSALYDKITHIEVDQSFVDKIFYHHGTIIVNTAGTNKGEITLKHIDYPIEFKNLLERLINREREQFGFRQSPVVTVEGELV